ncbi:hypothetical protein [Saccharothrix sp. NRRL B-16314]|uniref:hypothetical protein n=1 Tax=Saccharothrix sp. NRRL B-16314 TaxID=1463825 RepID=UPI0005277030|nr:hypothetical protein [Saccharothrix sp. NRRL B-16314]
MCRAGGRRCPNAGGHATQNTRQAVSRARKALREAKEIGNPTAVDTARQRLTDARTAHQEAKDAVNHHHDEGQDHATDPSTTADQGGDVTPEAPAGPPTTPPSTPDTTGHGQDHDDDGFNHVGTVTGTVHTHGDVVHHGDTIRIRTTGNRDATPTGHDPDRDARRAQRDARRAERDARRAERDAHRDRPRTVGDVHQFRYIRHHDERPTFTDHTARDRDHDTAPRGGDVTDNPATNAAAAPSTQDQVTTISVRVQGTCPDGHLVFYNLPVKVVPGSHRGFATATTHCPSCRQLVSMSGQYTA